MVSKEWVYAHDNITKMSDDELISLIQSASEKLAMRSVFKIR